MSVYLRFLRMGGTVPPAPAVPKSTGLQPDALARLKGCSDWLRKEADDSQNAGWVTIKIAREIAALRQWAASLDELKSLVINAPVAQPARENAWLRGEEDADGNELITVRKDEWDRLKSDETTGMLGMDKNKAFEEWFIRYGYKHPVFGKEDMRAAYFAAPTHGHPDECGSWVNQPPRMPWDGQTKYVNASEDERAAIEFYLQNPSVALFDWGHSTRRPEKKS